MHHLCYLSDPTDASGDVRHMRTSHQPRLLREEGPQLLRIAGWILRVGSRPPLDGQAHAFRQLDPWCGIGFMIELGQDQLITSLKPEGGREVVEELGG